MILPRNRCHPLHLYRRRFPLIRAISAMPLQTGIIQCRKYDKSNMKV